MDFAAGEDVRFRQLMVDIGNDTPDEMATRLVPFMASIGTGGGIGTDVARQDPDITFAPTAIVFPLKRGQSSTRALNAAWHSSRRCQAFAANW